MIINNGIQTQAKCSEASARPQACGSSGAPGVERDAQSSSIRLSRSSSCAMSCPIPPLFTLVV